MVTNNTDAATPRDASRGTGDGVDTFMSPTQKLRIITDSSRDVKVHERKVQVSCGFICGSGETCAVFGLCIYVD